MGILADLAELVSPTRCVGCDLPGSLMCDDCRARALRFDGHQSCPRCGAPHGYLVCTECWQTEYAFSAAVSLGELAPPLSRAVVIYKDGHERRLGAVLGQLLAERVQCQGWAGWADAVAWVPASPAAVARRGFDHASEIAHSLACALAVGTTGVLGRQTGGDQRLLGRRERAENIHAAFTANGDAAGRLLLVDDVFTTGSTLEEATQVLLSAGAEEIRVAVVARAW